MPNMRAINVDSFPKFFRVRHLLHREKRAMNGEVLQGELLQMK